jgi:hypothetical protein
MEGIILITVALDSRGSSECDIERRKTLPNLNCRLLEDFGNQVPRSLVLSMPLAIGRHPIFTASLVTLFAAWTVSLSSFEVTSAAPILRLTNEDPSFRPIVGGAKNHMHISRQTNKERMHE